MGHDPQRRQRRHRESEIRTTRLNPRMGPFPAPVVVAGVQVVGVVVGVAADRIVMVGVVAESAAAGQMVAVLDSWHGRTVRTTESEVAARG